MWTSARSELEAIGMQVSAVTDTESWQVVAGFLPVSAVSGAAQVTGLKSLTPTAFPERSSSGIGVNEWEALSFDDQLRRILPSVDGTDMDIGIMSDSINQVGGKVAGSQSTGDLPPGGRVNILSDWANPNATDEGRAMAELVYDLGPGFDIIYHTAFRLWPHQRARGRHGGEGHVHRRVCRGTQSVW